ncbi:hypothetical protein Pmani_005644 [Petrolisthes manimaculis]|uniref:Uncharacterized protein n=1 Tax=Petrolisthes manimaculis TaxID=1843537 RepID=A0AAE1UGG8_9EUCA|nr:hypothetical protein Pmani_005644 [Petrolisthes manimaculis]
MFPELTDNQVKAYEAQVTTTAEKSGWVRSGPDPLCHLTFRRAKRKGSEKKRSKVKVETKRQGRNRREEWSGSNKTGLGEKEYKNIGLENTA